MRIMTTFKNLPSKGGGRGAFWGRFFESGYDIYVFTLTDVPLAPAV
jgi:hypothetical protein